MLETKQEDEIVIARTIEVGCTDDAFSSSLVSSIIKVHFNNSEPVLSHPESST